VDTLAKPKESKYLVTGNQQIIKLCNRIIASKNPITVHFNRTRESFTSLLFDVNINSRTCFLDQLMPTHGNELLLAGQSASIQCKLAGITTWFGAGQILASGTTKDQPWLEMALPTRAWYQQRRNAFRAQAIGAMDLTIKLFSRDRVDSIDARIQDLSVTGCRVVVSQQPDPLIELNEAFYRCQLLQADRQVISCGAEVRHVEEAEPNGQQQFGMSFTDMTPQHDAVLSQLVIKLERGLNQAQLLA